MARYSQEHIDALRKRMRHDIHTTLRNFNLDHITARMHRMSFEMMVDDLVEDAMHPLEKVIADIHDEDSLLGRGQ